MTRKELFATIPNIITGYDGITYFTDDQKWFDINVKGCIYPYEIDSLRKFCFVGSISFNLINRCFEISCTDLD